MELDNNVIKMLKNRHELHQNDHKMELNAFQRRQNTIKLYK